MKRGVVVVLSLALLAPVTTAAPPPADAASTTTSTAPKRKATASTTTTTSAESARQAAIATELKTLRQQVEEASAREAEVLDALDEVAASRRSVERDLAGIDAELATATAEVEAADLRLAAVSADLVRAETKYVATEDDLSGARLELADRAVSAYIHQPSAQLASVVLERQSFRELAAARDFLRSVVEARARAVDRYRGLRTAISDERDALAVARIEVQAHKEAVTAHREELLRVRHRQDSLRAKATSEEGRQRVLLTDVRGRVREFEAEIASLKQESDAIGSLLRARAKAQALARAQAAKAAATKPTPKVKAPTGSGVLAAPVPGGISSGFGPRQHPIFATTRNHAGVDYTATTGTPVRAAADGTVVLAGARGGYGSTVLIDHENGLATLYAHLSRLAVVEGAVVGRGSVVGYVGSSGFSTGPHLHFEVRVDGNPVDPSRFL